MDGTALSPRFLNCPFANWFYMVCPATVAPVPTLQLLPTRTSLSMQWSLDMIIPSTQQPCSSYFSNAVSVLGPDASTACTWVSPRNMRIALSPTLSPSPVLTTPLTLVATLFQAVSSGAQPTVAQVALTPSLQTPTLPVPLIVGPTQLTPCDTVLVLSGQSSTGWPWATGSTFAWTASPTTPAITAAIASATAASSLVLTVQPIDLTPGVTYSFTLSITPSSGGSAASVTHNVVRIGLPRVSVQINAPSQITIYAFEELILQAIVTPGLNPPTPCDPYSSGTVYSYAWTKVSGPDVLLDRATQVSSTYRIAPNSLTGFSATDPTKATYVIECSVDIDDNLFTVGRAWVSVTVLRSPLVALPYGLQVETRLGDVIIDGRNSQDADFIPASVSPQPGPPTYQWQCQQMDNPSVGCVVSSIVTAPQATQTGLVTFPTANLAPGTWLFTMVYLRDNLQARAFQTLQVNWNDAPAGELALLDPSRLQIMGSGSQAQAYRLSINANQPLVVYARDVLVFPKSTMASWSWLTKSAEGNTLDLSTSTSAYLYIPQGTLTPGAGYVFHALATDTSGRISNMSFSIEVNSGPRANNVAASSSCFFVQPVPAQIEALRTVLTITCTGWVDDAANYPLGYMMISGAFMLNTGYYPSGTFSFVLPDASSSNVVVQVADALGAFTQVSLAVPNAITSPFTSDNALDISVVANRLICASRDASCRAGSLQEAVDVGSVERINQVGQGIMVGLTQAYSGGVDAATLATLRSQWQQVFNMLDKYFVAQPYTLWSRNEGVKFSTQSRNALLLDPTLQNITLDGVAWSFQAWPPGTRAIGDAFVPMFSNVVAGMAVHPPAVNVSRIVSFLFVNTTQVFLGAQLSGGVAVPQGTVSATYDSAHVGFNARNDTFSSPSFVPSFVPFSFVVQHAGRVHNLTLSNEAVQMIEQASPVSHGMQAFAADYDIFAWASSPPLVLASDVVMFRVSSERNNQEISVAGSNVTVVLQRTVAGGAAPSTNTVLTCAIWHQEWELWGTDNCTTISTTDTFVTCLCTRTGIFAAVWAPIIGDGSQAGPLLPLGPTPGFVVPWLPIVVALLLLALIALLLLLWCCMRRIAPPFSVPVKPAAGVALYGEDERLDDWSAHLDRPVGRRVALNTNANIDEYHPHHMIHYEHTSSGEDDWPSDNPPDWDRVAAPLAPRPDRRTLVGGRVTLVRDDNNAAKVIEAEQPLLMSMRSAAVPWLDEESRMDAQVGRPQDDEYSSASEKKDK